MWETYHYLKFVWRQSEFAFFGVHYFGCAHFFVFGRDKMKQQITAQMVRNAVEFFKTTGFIKDGDVSVIGAHIINPHPLNYKFQFYMMIAKPRELQLHKLDNTTLTCTGDILLFPFDEIKKAKTKRTSVFFGEQYFIIKHNNGKIQINTPDVVFDYDQEVYVISMKNFFERNF